MKQIIRMTKSDGKKPEESEKPDRLHYFTLCLSAELKRRKDQQVKMKAQARRRNNKWNYGKN